MLKIWGRLNSINVQKVVWAAEETGVAFERIDAGGQFGLTDTADYAKRNPMRLVPAIDDDGFVLWESNAIVRYLCARHAGAGLWPADVRARAEADRWSDWIAGAFYQAYNPAFAQLIRTPEDKRDMAAVEVSHARTEQLLPILDAHLASHANIGGAGFSYGDIIVGPSIHRWLNMPLDKATWPNIERWYRAFMSRPAARKVLTLPIT